MARVLVIDDREDICSLMEAVVTREGHECALAGNVVAARRLIGDGFTPDLIFCDVRMPNGHEGPEFISELRVRGDFAHLPVVFVTSVPEEVPSSLPGSGPVEILAKPFRFEDIENCLQLLL